MFTGNLGDYPHNQIALSFWKWFVLHLLSTQVMLYFSRVFDGHSGLVSCCLQLFCYQIQKRNSSDIMFIWFRDVKSCVSKMMFQGLKGYFRMVIQVMIKKMISI